MNLFKKILGILAVIGLVSLPVLAQDSSVQNVPMSVEFSGGCTLSITPGTFTIADLPVPASQEEEGSFIASDEGPQDYYIGYRLTSDHSASLVIESAEKMVHSNQRNPSYSIHVQTTWDGDIGWSGNPPDFGEPAVEIWNSGTESVGSKTGTVTFAFQNSYLMKQGTITGSLNFTVLDVGAGS